MSTSAGAATAAPAELGAAVRSETEGAPAAIVIVSRDPGVSRSFRARRSRAFDNAVLPSDYAAVVR